MTATGSEKPTEAAESESARRSPDAVSRGKWLEIRESLPAWTYWALGVIPIAVILGLWWLVTGSGPAEERVISPTILPSPLEVAQSLRSLLDTQLQIDGVPDLAHAALAEEGADLVAVTE